MKIYIAGTDVFLPNADDILKRKKKLCRKYSFEGLSPFDKDGKFSAEIYHNNLALINEADVVIANLNDFRGDCIDDGTAFEIGYATALKKKIYGYRTDTSCMVKRLGEKDENGYFVEDWGNCCNLMIAEAAYIIKGDFEDALKAVSDMVLGI